MGLVRGDRWRWLKLREVYLGPKELLAEIAKLLRPDVNARPREPRAANASH